MEEDDDAHGRCVHKFPQSKYVDDVRWLPPFSALDRYAVLALFDFDVRESSIEIHSLPRSNRPHPSVQSSWMSPSRVSSISVSQNPDKPLIAASTYSGSFHLLYTSPLDTSLGSESSLCHEALHDGEISCIDLQGSGGDCVTVGEDGRVNLVSIGDGKLNLSLIFDSNGLVSYHSVKWGSSVEFATGGTGFGLQWWDLRKPGGAVSRLKGDWVKKRTSGIVHSIDIHPSRKHICLAGGSMGTVFAWDLRWQHQPIMLSVGNDGNNVVQLTPESEVWRVQYDTYNLLSHQGNASSSRILPAMLCSEEGSLSVVRQGEEPIDLMSEPCAINSFDIDRQNPSDVICSLEWESIALLTRA